MVRKPIIVVAAVAVALMGAGLGVRSLMPKTVCSISFAQYKALPMTVSYNKARGMLGCDGILVSREEHDGKVIETYGWRGTAWLYGRAEAVFINDALETKSFRLAELIYSIREVESTDKGYYHRMLREMR